ncbi:uncharacterized protein KGF55_005498 [Candida pseudojiufengensis]|uniref:uncharacterized protein n=1 Tax=Candida pseudojiufengensis TaxID=497109 RepID=UPI002224A9BC|nr:uncharacterized protein KGF55_005498 [Candida pseudojiufengensis]KAI5959155.1 hypothetical protein KGF55_005498 [Candida pseudojiufengensis]
MSYRLVTLNSGNKIPSIGLGTYNIPGSKTTQIVYEALKVGYKSFDTAVLYGNEEEVIAGISQFLKDNKDVKRSDIFYTTKLWNNQVGKNETTKAINKMMEQIGDLEYIDMLLIHSPLPGKQRRLDAWKIMQEAVAQGKIKNIGVSNYGPQHIEELLNWSELKIPPAVNQIEISPWCMRDEIANWCLNKNIQVEAYAPLTHGQRLQKQEPEFAQIMKKYNKTAAQILIKWSLQKGYIPLPKTATPSRLKENLEVNDFELTPEEINIISQEDVHDPTDWETFDAP